MVATDDVPVKGIRGNLAGLLSLAAASCLAVTTEILPVGLLPVVGRSFGVTESVIGMLVSLYAVMVAVLAVPLTLVTSRFARKPLLLATLAGYALSNALVATAPLFAVAAAGRMVGGVTHALFFSLLIGYAPRLVSRTYVGRALALITGGASAGLILGVPLLTSLGTACGWRVSFAVLTVLSLITFVLVTKLLASVSNERARYGSARTGRCELAAVATSNTLTYLGQFTLYTFVSVLLLASGVGPAFVGPILLVCGASGLLGLWYAGKNLDRGPRRTAVVILVVLIGAIVAVGSARTSLAAVIAAVAVWNAAFGGVPSVYQACAVRTHAVSPELAGAWMNATANVGIAGGAAIGAGLLQSAGVWSLPWVGAALASLGLGVILLSRNGFPTRP